MDFNNFYIDELVDIRKSERLKKNWDMSDKIRNYLDGKFVFVFDGVFGQEVYHFTESYFNNKQKKLDTLAMSNRQYVEFRIKQDIVSNNNFNAWLYSINNG